MKILHEYNINGKRIVYADYTDEELKLLEELQSKLDQNLEKDNITIKNDGQLSD